MNRKKSAYEVHNNRKKHAYDVHNPSQGQQSERGPEDIRPSLLRQAAIHRAGHKEEKHHVEGVDHLPLIGSGLDDRPSTMSRVHRLQQMPVDHEHHTDAPRNIPRCVALRRRHLRHGLPPPFESPPL